MIAREKVNEGRHIVVYNIGDIVTVRVQVQSNTSRNRVANLSYKSKGPFFVKEVLGYGCYMLQRWNSEDATLQKYHGSNM
jgi:flagellar basal body L-ring protein FlgH